MTVLELKTGLFPDADAAGKAVAALKDQGNAAVSLDLSALEPEDRDGWAAAVQAILAADMVVTI